MGVLSFAAFIVGGFGSLVVSLPLQFPPYDPIEVFRRVHPFLCSILSIAGNINDIPVDGNVLFAQSSCQIVLRIVSDDVFDRRK